MLDWSEEHLFDTQVSSWSTPWSVFVIRISSAAVGRERTDSKCPETRWLCGQRRLPSSFDSPGVPLSRQGLEFATVVLHFITHSFLFRSSFASLVTFWKRFLRVFYTPCDDWPGWSQRSKFGSRSLKALKLSFNKFCPLYLSIFSILRCI